MRKDRALVARAVQKLIRAELCVTGRIVVGVSAEL